MKYLYLLIMFIGIVGFFLITEYQAIERHNELVQEMQDLKEVVLKCNYSDSLMHEHMKECSYIMRSDVKVGYKGALYSAYHKKYTH